MRTRQADTPKSATTAKKTPVAKKSAAKTPPKRTEQAPESTKTPPKPTEPVPESSATPNSAEVKSLSTTEFQQVKTATASPTTITTSTAPESEPEPPAVKEANAAADAVQVTPETEPTPGAKKTRKVIRKVMVRRKTSASAKAASNKSPKPGEPEQIKVEETSKKEEQTPVNTEVSTEKEETAVENVEGSTKEDQNVSKNEGTQDVESVNKEEQTPMNTEASTKKEETAVENVEISIKEDQNVGDVEEPTKKEEAASDAPSLVENIAISSKEEDPAVTDTMESSENQEISMTEEEKETKVVEESLENQEISVMEEEKETKVVEDKVEPDNESVNMEKDFDERPELEDFPQKEDVSHGDEKMEERSDRENHEEVGDQEDNVVEHGEKVEAMKEEPAAEELEEENVELTAMAHERKSKREMEIFVGGLDRDATEEDVKKVFVSVGEVLEVRLHKSSTTNKNKGYAFVKFATKEQASRALAEIKNPIIRGKRCGTAPSEDNNTLFLGNICNSWTKEAIKQKLKDYSIEGVESITLVPNPQHEGLSRGFAFVEFSCHADAMLAYKRLQKPDAIFGHSERTAKVAFAEPLREPDPEVMAQVKSVFIDGLPQYWDEDRVRQQFKGYGEIERITLARNMSTAKRKDFGFVDFTTHEAAIACIDDINTKELGDGNKKTKVKARLSNPQPKIQVVKGGMCGGFRIGRAGSGTFAKNGKAFGRGGHSFNRSDFQGSRGFYQRGRGQPGASFANERELDNPYASFQGRQNFGRGGRWGSSSGAHHVSGGSNLPARVNLDRQRYNGPSDRGRGRNMPYRGHPFSPEEELNRPFLGRHTDEHYMYDDISRGIKRPYFPDHDPDYLEPSRVRPRLDYADPPAPLRGPYYRDTYGAGSGLYSDSRDYYGPDYGRGAHSSFYGGHRPYGGGYYY